MHTLAIDLDHAIQQLRGIVPARVPHDETAEQFRTRQAAATAIRAMEAAARELRGETAAFEAQSESLFAHMGD